jgi:hypothetical protein
MRPAAAQSERDAAIVWKAKGKRQKEKGQDENSAAFINDE